ncbi:hypothetical protein GCM10009804_37520 [Kribbella hippodromi]|uniref:3-hydroxyacyl-CoA dehydrogenase n=1 Tax=Kribbella hippodromi TaxID=434347 RepID=A0ABP4PBG4_9ACTN
MPAAGRYGGELNEKALTSRLGTVKRLGVGAVGGAGQPVGARTPLALGAVEEATEGTKSVEEGEAGAAQAVRAGVPAGVRAGGGPGVPVPEARAWGARLAQAVSEVLVGDRPISQLVRFVDESVFADVNRRVRMLGMTSTAGSRGAKEKSTMRSVRVFMPEPSIAEVSAHVRHGDRSRAIALRMEIRRNRWVCTALELG